MEAEEAGGAVAVGSAEAAADADLPEAAADVDSPAAGREATAGPEATAVWDRAGTPVEASGADTATTEVDMVTTEVDMVTTEVDTAGTEADTVITEAGTADGDTDVGGDTAADGVGVIRGGASAPMPRTRITATGVTRTTTRTDALMATRPATDAGTR
jgi:hypothetical protein